MKRGRAHRELWLTAGLGGKVALITRVGASAEKSSIVRHLDRALKRTEYVIRTMYNGAFRRRCCLRIESDQTRLICTSTLPRVACE